MNIQHRHFRPFALDNFDAEPTSAQMLNSEGSLIIRIDYEDGNQPTVYDGPLAEHGNYTLQQIFWFWFEKSDPKYDLGDIKFPAELHLLLYNTNYEDIRESNGVQNYALMVLTFPFKVII